MKQRSGRPGRSGRRRANRRRRTLAPRLVRDLAASTIQAAFRAHLGKRYRGSMKNFDGDDCISLEPVRLIPKKLAVVVDGVGYPSPELLKWLKVKGTNPLTRLPVNPGLSNDCRRLVKSFVRKDCVLRGLRRGRFARRRRLLACLSYPK